MSSFRGGSGSDGHVTAANHPLGRARLSCVPCRKRKSKCDERIPCSSCVLRGTTETCQLPDANTSVPRRSVPQQTHVHSPQSSTPPMLRASSSSDTSMAPPPPAKRRRPSPVMRTISYDGVVGSSDLDGSGDDSLKQLAELQKGISVLESTIRKQQTLQKQQRASLLNANSAWSANGPNSLWPSVPVRAHPNPLPKSDQNLIDQIIACFPSQSDCEILLEFVLQEPDWIVNCISSQWLIPIWSRLVYGGRVTKAEAALIAAAMAVSALLLSETPHVFYETSVAPAMIHPVLTDFVQNHLEEQQRKPLEEHSDESNPEGLLDDFITLGLALDYLRFSGSRRIKFWPLVKASIRRRADHAGLMNEDTRAWRNFDHLETEMARRVVWHVIVCERWGSVYADFVSPYPLREEDIKVKKPSWIETSLSAPFRASPSGLNFTTEDGRTPVDCKLELRSSARNVPRLFRHKGPEESINAAEISEIAIALSALAPDVSDYISLIKGWKKQHKQQRSQQQQQQQQHQHQQRQKPSEGDKSPNRTVSPPDWTPDHRREALLHQGVALCEDIKTYQASILSRCSEPQYLDTRDYFACRRANQGSIIHTGVRQILDAVVSGWVTQEMVADVSSPLLVKLQKEAYKNARDVVATIDLTRTLLTCGKATYFGSWAAYTFFNAATTLAIPLLGAKRLREETAKAEEKLGKIVLIDRYTRMGQNQDKESSKDTEQRTDEEEEGPAPISNGAIISTPALSMEELKTLAPDILRILDLLPIFTASPLGQEARQRLSILVDTYKIGQSTGTNQDVNANGHGNGGSHGVGFSSSGSTPLHPYHHHHHQQQQFHPPPQHYPSSSFASQQQYPFHPPSNGHQPTTQDLPVVSHLPPGHHHHHQIIPPPFGMTPPVLSPVLPPNGGMDVSSNDIFAANNIPPVNIGASEWRDARNYSVLDDLVALDDAWWGEILSNNTNNNSGSANVQAQHQQGSS